MDAQAHLHERMRDFPQRCRSAGLKVTHQRTAIYQMLAATERHPSPEEVYEAVRPELPSISLATVYKVLDLFHHHGFLRKISTEKQVARYDANVGEHGHLICDRCGSIKDVPVDGVAGIHLPDQGAFAVSRLEVVFHGVCGDCR
jgi:Fur family peroxide stress response transcriptional regulator